ncbi:Uncharacterised protein [Mycolicibacterium vanbaalenii]|uniref:Uncharacterized protein n=1 Tax=Mycolicibacterium vanbaalenii TaxID=110539 RepID=A0A5S9R8E8_MYCVN|nr:hypothetical protein [Mycolicibacterium vanbaalenii]CAA0134577.1 Uncharacterised protein [Mycolicibacterium vanbaalenii]
MTTWEPMDVEMMETQGGGGTLVSPHPAHDPEWSRMDELRWRAGVLRANTGVTVTFNDQPTFRRQDRTARFPELVGVIVEGPAGSMSCSEFDRDLLAFLNAVEVGASVMGTMLGAAAP